MVAALSSVSSAVTISGGGTYTDNLDGLGASTPWANDSTLSGWYAFESGGSGLSSWDVISSGTHNDYALSIGQGSPQQGLLNFGNSDSSPDRALGSRPSGRDYTFALVLRNDTSTHYTDFELSYYGEQWQMTDGATSYRRLSFSYGVFSGFDGTNHGTVVPPLLGGQDFYTGYTVPANNALDFSAFVFGGSVSALDGNATANRKLLSANQPVDWSPGQYLVLRWLAPQPNVGGNVQTMLAVDDVQITATPEPSSVLLMIGSGAMLLLRRRRAASL